MGGSWRSALHCPRAAPLPSAILRFNGTVERDPAIEAWLTEREGGPLGVLARRWFEVMRACGDEVREVFHDGCPVACLGDAPFAYVNVFQRHMNVGFFHGASLADPKQMLEGTGRSMRHVKLRAETPVDDEALRALIAAAWNDIQARVMRD